MNSTPAASEAGPRPSVEVPVLTEQGKMVVLLRCSQKLDPASNTAKNSNGMACCNCSLDCGGAFPLRRVRGSHALRDLGTAFTLYYGDVILALQVKPELGTVSEISAEPDGRIGSDRPASVEDVCDATGWYAEVECKPICAELAGF
jgi:hypothetical protein